MCVTAIKMIERAKKMTLPPDKLIKKFTFHSNVDDECGEGNRVEHDILKPHGVDGDIASLASYARLVCFGSGRP